MLKRFLSLLIAFMLLPNCAASVNAAATDTNRQIEMKTFPFYLNSREETWPEEFPLYFVDGVYDMPFVEVNDWAEVLNWYFTTEGGDLYADYKITVNIEEDKNQVFYLRDNGSFMIMDFNKGTILWDDYGMFYQAKSGDYMDLAGLKDAPEEGEINLLKTTAEHVRYAESTVLNLKDYSIPMIAQDGKYLLPMQTLSTFCLILVYHSMYFNQQCLIMAEGMKMTLPSSGIEEIMQLITPEILETVAPYASTPEEAQALAAQMVAQTEEGMALISRVQEEYEKSLYNLYVSGEKGEPSPQLMEFGYNELCLELDSLYGQKKDHNISDFNSFFLQTGLTGSIMAGDLQQADDCLEDHV